jgi:hypothetical protein
MGHVAVDDSELKAIWNQGTVPVILRRSRKGQQLRIRLPYADDNRHWLKGERTQTPHWSSLHRCWETPKAWFNELVEQCLQRHGKLYIIQPYREQEKCSPACMNAQGHECQCSCMGANHGAGNDGSWFEVSDTFATKWGDEYLACRLMTARSPAPA